MTPKDKAKELIGKFYVNIPLRDCDNRRPHKLALIAVDELINCTLPSCEFGGIINNNTIEYWEEVKKEIEKL
jgi:hypothetical protein